MKRVYVGLASSKNDLDIIREKLAEHGIPMKQWDPNIFSFTGERKIFDKIKKLQQVIHLDSENTFKHSDQVRMLDPINDNWALDRIDQRFLPLDHEYTINVYGVGVDIYVIDTGINLIHNEFAGRITPLFDAYTNSSSPNFCLDVDGHGSHVSSLAAGTRYGVASMAQIFPVRIFQDNSATTTTILDGIQAVLDDVLAKPVNTDPTFRPSVCNMSFTGPADPTLNAAVVNLIENNVVVCTAAGNFTTSAANYSPASAPGAITVAASGQDDSFATFSDSAVDVSLTGSQSSNFGSIVDIIAPGINILGAYVPTATSRTALSGTSMSSPFVAGSCALYLQFNKTATPKEVGDWLISTSTKNAITLTKAATVAGTPNRLLYINFQSSGVTWQTLQGSIGQFNSGTEVNYTFLAGSTDGSGNPLPINYTIIDGQLPQGLTLNSGGVLSGIPTTLLVDTIYNFTISASDGRGTAVTQSFSVTILATLNPPTWITQGGVIGNYVFTSQNSMPVTINLVVNNITSISTTFSIISGNVPNNLVLNSTGQNTAQLSGNLINVAGQQVFTFVIRASNTQGYSDQTFIINVIGFIAPPFWNLTPISFQDDVPVFSLGNQIQGQSQSLNLDGIDPNGLPLTYALVSGLLPKGLSLVNGFITGVIDPSATPTTYNFTISLSNGTFTILGLFQLTVIERDPNLQPPPVNSVIWITPSGNLGTIEELDPSWFLVKAQSSDGSVLTYALSPNSGALPPGLAIDTLGNIDGTVGYVPNKTTYTFSVRATANGTFLDQAFAITVLKNFTQPILTFSFILTGPDKIRTSTWASNTTNIPTSVLFKPESSLFGVVTNPSIFLCGGIPATVTADDIVHVMEPEEDPVFSTYFQKMGLVLGPITSAIARDVNNNVVYEVLYKQIIDPQVLAGGFSGPSPGIETKVNWPDAGLSGTGIDIDFVYPNSIQNVRYALESRLGIAGTEQLPMWMRCEQVANDATTVLGYVPALIYAYLIPGTSASLLANIRVLDLDASETGQLFIADRVFVNLTDTFVLQTTFDTNTTTFDSDTTVFDFFSSSNTGKYIKFPPGDVVGIIEPE